MIKEIDATTGRRFFVLVNQLPSGPHLVHAFGVPAVKAHAREGAELHAFIRSLLPDDEARGMFVCAGASNDDRFIVDRHVSDSGFTVTHVCTAAPTRG